MPDQTIRYRLRLMALIGAGVAVALQIGKVPAALPFLQQDLGLSLVQSGWVVALFGLIAAGFAAMIGGLADRVGQLRAALAGMALTAAASLAGSRAQTAEVLLAFRVLEGLGYLLTATSIPPLILRLAPEDRRSAALALWGLFVPFGSFLMMALSGPVLQLAGWRALWLLTGGLIVLAMLPLWHTGRRLARPGGLDAPRPRPSLRDALRTGPLLGCFSFGAYASQYFILTGFLPTVLMGEDAVPAMAAAGLGALVILFNAGGILAGGWMLGRGARPSTLILAGGCAMALLGLVVFNTALPVPTRMIAAFLYAFLAALVPSSLFASIPRLAGSSGAVSTMSGMLAQGSGIGQMTGPPLVAALVVSSGGWWAAAPVMLALAISTIVMGVALRRFV